MAGVTLLLLAMGLVVEAVEEEEQQAEEEEDEVPGTGCSSKTASRTASSSPVPTVSAGPTSSPSGVPSVGLASLWSTAPAPP